MRNVCETYKLVPEARVGGVAVRGASVRRPGVSCISRFCVAACCELMKFFCWDAFLADLDAAWAATSLQNLLTLDLANLFDVIVDHCASLRPIVAYPHCCRLRIDRET
jgi:hypothetical protein